MYMNQSLKFYLSKIKLTIIDKLLEDKDYPINDIIYDFKYTCILLNDKYRVKKIDIIIEEFINEFLNIFTENVNDKSFELINKIRLYYKITSLNNFIIPILNIDVDNILNNCNVIFKCVQQINYSISNTENDTSLNNICDNVDKINEDIFKEYADSYIRENFDKYFYLKEKIYIEYKNYSIHILNKLFTNRDIVFGIVEMVFGTDYILSEIENEYHRELKI